MLNCKESEQRKCGICSCRKKGAAKITFKNIQASPDEGSAKWAANYLFGKEKRKVITKVKARFKFKDGEISEPTDTFDLWERTKQAMGPIG